ncbi:MAG: DUF222 domain-containing protein [Candidatus Eisenbacteria bacterium]|nr:DUF222 domain-containing protein [Candidatus Eisenbacteria bacterium]
MPAAESPARRIRWNPSSTAGSHEPPEAVRALHAAILKSAAAQRQLDARLLRLFREMDQLDGHRAYVCITMTDYVGLILGIDPMAARERMRVARALGRLPRIEAALAEGRISYAKARAVTRVAQPETETGWLEEAGLPALYSNSEAGRCLIYVGTEGRESGGRLWMA